MSKRPNHWHVETGGNGYLPDDVAIFTTRRVAEGYAISEAADSREAGLVVSGSARSGRYDLGWERGAEFRHIIVEPCVEPDCELAEFEWSEDDIGVIPEGMTFNPAPAEGQPYFTMEEGER